MHVTVTPDGSVEFIYSDSLLPLTNLGSCRITRASHVEPSDGGWTADLSPVSGPVLGPYRTRQEALDAEVAWLQTNVLSA
jgi:hypothetical protein